MTDADDDGDSDSRLPLLGVAGALSLCCVFAAPASTAVVGGTAAGTTTAAVGGGAVQIFVAAVTVAAIAFFYRLRAHARSAGD
jgi:hypothetical protein